MPATWCLPSQRLPFREGDRQARLINGAFDGWLHSSWRSQKKAPPKSGAKFATHLGFACEAANPPLNVERRSCFRVEHPTGSWAHWVDTMPNPNSRTEIGTRLVLTRKALDYTQTAMAGLMGIDGQTLAAYEAGRRRIPMKHALKLCPPPLIFTQSTCTRTSATKFGSSQAMRSGEGTKADGR